MDVHESDEWCLFALPTDAHGGLVAIPFEIS